MDYASGHSILSDFNDYPDTDNAYEVGFYKNCGFQTHDEAAILYKVANEWQGDWLDIGGHTGWTVAHMMLAGKNVITAIDPMYKNAEFRQRTFKNLFAVGDRYWGFVGSEEWLTFPILFPFRSDHYFSSLIDHHYRHDGVMIDGDHGLSCVMADAKNAMDYLKPSGVIMFHDFLGGPVQRGVEFLMDRGFNCRVYYTPHMVACCWRGNWNPPDHVRDPGIDWEKRIRTMDFKYWDRAV